MGGGEKKNCERARSRLTFFTSANVKLDTSTLDQQLLYPVLMDN